MAQKQDIRTQLLTASPFQLMLSLSVPAIIGMVVVGLYSFYSRRLSARVFGFRWVFFMLSFPGLPGQKMTAKNIVTQVLPRCYPLRRPPARAS